MQTLVTNQITYTHNHISLYNESIRTYTEVEGLLSNQEKELINSFMDKFNNILQGNIVYRLPDNLPNTCATAVLNLYSNFNQKKIDFDYLKTLHQSIASFEKDQFSFEQSVIHLFNQEALQSPTKNFSFTLAFCLYLITGKKHFYEIVLCSFWSKRHSYQYVNFLQNLKHFYGTLLNYYLSYKSGLELKLQQNAYHVFSAQIALNYHDVKIQIQLYAIYKLLNSHDASLVFEMFDSNSSSLKYGEYSINERSIIKTNIMEFFSLVFKSCSNGLSDYGYPSFENSLLSFKFRNYHEFEPLRKQALPYVKLASLRKLDLAKHKLAQQSGSNKRTATEANLDTQVKQNKLLRLSVPENKLVTLPPRNFNCAEVFLDAAKKLAKN